MINSRLLPGTDIDLPCLALGTVKFGRNEAVKYPNKFDLPSDREIVELLEQCQRAGIDLLDTAPAYGVSEERIGKLLPGRRQDWLLGTKAGEAFVNGRSSFDFSAEGIQLSVEQSLKNFQTDYLDMVLIHSDGNDLKIIEETDALDALNKMKNAGKIRLAGMSTKTKDGGLAAIKYCDIVMLTLNLMDQSQLTVIEAAKDAKRGVLIKKAFNSGYASPSDNLRFILSHQAVTSAVVGTIDPRHMQENIAIATMF